MARPTRIRHPPRPAPRHPLAGLPVAVHLTDVAEAGGLQGSHRLPDRGAKRADLPAGDVHSRGSNGSVSMHRVIDAADHRVPPGAGPSVVLVASATIFAETVEGPAAPGEQPQ